MKLCTIFFFTLFVRESIGKDKQAQSKDSCWENEEYKIEEKCHVCSTHETYPACSLTGYIETVRCEKSGAAVKSCPRDKQREVFIFWKFEGAMIIMSLVAGAVVMLRMRKLDRENVERIQRQISAL